MPPAPSRLPWKKLIPGATTLAVVVVLAFAIVKFAGVGSMHGRTIRVYVVTDQASGVMRGTEVWLAGQRVGIVTDVSFLPPTSDTTAHIVLSLDLSAADANVIRRDADATLRAGSNFIAPTVVYLDPGTPTSPAIRAGDTLRAAPQHDAQVAMAKLSDAAAEVGPLLSDARALSATLHSSSGTVGALLRHGVAFPTLRARYARVTTRDGTGEAENDLLFHVRLAFARVDSVRALVLGPASALGRFRRDSSLAGSIAQVRAQLDTLSVELRSANGTVGRAQNDAAVLDAVSAARAQLTDLLADIRRHPARYINF